MNLIETMTVQINEDSKICDEESANALIATIKEQIQTQKAKSML